MLPLNVSQLNSIDTTYQIFLPTKIYSLHVAPHQVVFCIIYVRPFYFQLQLKAFFALKALKSTILLQQNPESPNYFFFVNSNFFLIFLMLYCLNAFLHQDP